MAAPQIISAIALSDVLVRVTFDQGMLNTTAFRLPSNYVFSGSGVTVTPSLITPEAITYPTYVDISLVNEMTDGALYTVTGTTNGNIQSSASETLDPSFDSATFTGSGTQPVVAGATSLGATQVRISFSETMLNNSAYLDVTNYTFSGGLTASSILSFTSTSITLSTSVQVGIGYIATVNAGTGIQDDSFNPLDGGSNTAAFTGLVLPAAPTVVSATNTLSTITVTFSSPMINNDEFNDPSNYTFVPGPGGASLTVSTITPEPVTYPSYVDLFVGEQTDGVNYTIEVNNVLDQIGTPIDTSNNTANFIGLGTAPKLIAAVPSDPYTVRLTFDEPIRLPSGLNSPASYSFSGGLTIQVAISPPAVSQPNYVDIVFNQEMVEGMLYTVVASLSLMDLKNNSLDPIFNSITFTGLGVLPYPEQAEFIDFTTIELQFNEDMSNNAALIDPLNYTLDNGGMVVSVTRISARIVHLNTASTNFADNYVLTVSSFITDLGGNPIDPLNNSVPVARLQLGVSGAIEIIEAYSINVLDAYNDGYAGEVGDVSNGLFQIQVGGSSPDAYSAFEAYSPEEGYTVEGYYAAGTPFELSIGNYEFDYDTFLDTNFTTLPSKFYIGRDFLGLSPANAVMDDFRISNAMLLDTRPGESLPSGQESITVNAQRITSFKDFLRSLKSTLVLLDFEGGVKNLAPFIKFFTQGYFLAENSVNGNFGRAVRFITDRAFLVDNNGIFNPNEGSIEFWIRPLLNTDTDRNRRYYVDLKSSISSNRMSIYKHENGRLVWEIVDDDGQLFRISCKTHWRKCDWHRVAVSWNFNNEILNTDSMHMVVDNEEVSGIFYGTTYTSGGPILYGSGILYGECAEDVGTIRGISNATIRFTGGNANPNSQNINIPRIVIGSNDDDTENPGGFIAFADIDNLRISNTDRSVLVLSSGFGAGPNSSLTIPVIADNFTTLVEDFSEAELEQDDGAILIDRSRGVFNFSVEVIDSFDKVINDPEARQLIIDLVNTIKPSHTIADVSFEE